MNTWTLATISLILAVIVIYAESPRKVLPKQNAAVVFQNPDTAVAVRRIFSTKCTTCHGPQLEKPEGRFGYVLDLERIASNPEMVIRSSPDESELWLLVRKGEMPPNDSPDGPLSEAEKQVVRAWIEAGAPGDRDSADRATNTRVNVSRSASPLAGSRAD